MGLLGKLFGRKQPDVIPVDDSAMKILLEKPYGTALPISVKHDGRIVTAFLFHVSKDRIAELERSGGLTSMRTNEATFELSGVILHVTLFQIGDQVFEIWWNWHDHVIRPLFESLFEQTEVIVGFVSDQPKIERVVQRPSTIQRWLRANRPQLDTAPSWTMRSFDEARDYLKKYYGTPDGLFHLRVKSKDGFLNPETKISLAKDEYLRLESFIDAFDSRAFTIKAWSVTFSLAAVAGAFASHATPVLFVAALSATLFWIIETHWNGIKAYYYARIEELESFFRGENDFLIPMQISASWTLKKNRERTKPENLKRFFRAMWSLHIALPHSVILLLSLLLWLASHAKLITL